MSGKRRLDDGGEVTWLLSSILPLGFLEASFHDWQLGSLGGHALRVAAYTYVIAECYGLHEKICERFRIAAAFHDIGKMLLPRELLNKPSPLNLEERQEIEAHTLLGHELLLASEHPSLLEAALVAANHHERLDGSGYPHQRVDREIPLSAQIVGIADVFDALTSERPYRKAYSEGQAFAYLQQHGGTRFDPVLLTALERAFVAYPRLGERLRWFTGEQALREPLQTKAKETFEAAWQRQENWFDDGSDWLELL